MAKKNTTTLPPDIPEDVPNIHLDHPAGLAVLYDKCPKLWKTKTGIENAVSYTTEGYCWTNENAAICVYEKNIEPFKIGKAFVKYVIESPQYMNVFKIMKEHKPVKEVTSVFFHNGDLELKSLNAISFFKKKLYVQIGEYWYYEPTISTFLLFAQKAGRDLVNVDFFITEGGYMPCLYGIMTDTDSRIKLADFVMMPYVSTKNN